jgi:hypothetical protein
MLRTYVICKCNLLFSLRYVILYLLDKLSFLVPFFVCLLEQIEDVSFIESGLHVDSKQAYATVRHIKFETKKSDKKKYQTT